MAKILVTPVNGKCTQYEGSLTSEYFNNDGLIYYIAGESFPAEIVEVLEGEAINV